LLNPLKLLRVFYLKRYELYIRVRTYNQKVTLEAFKKKILQKKNFL